MPSCRCFVKVERSVVMITYAAIRGGGNYLKNHVRKADYYAEGETVAGEWIGAASGRLGLPAEVTDADFSVLAENRQLNGKRLTPRDGESRVAFYDIQFSAPKDVSVLALVGGDERVKEAFQAAVKTAHAEMERYAGTRLREGDAWESEQVRQTGNMASALFFHDASRQLDPQLHGHAVTVNATWERETGKWKALQPRQMMEASKHARVAMYHDLAARLNALGYETHSLDRNGFAVAGVEHLRERFSKRAVEVDGLAREFRDGHGREASPAELREFRGWVEHFKLSDGELQRKFRDGWAREPSPKEYELMVKSSRRDKPLKEISTPEVRALQTGQLSDREREALAALVETAKAGKSRVETPAEADPETAVQRALDHVFERSSVSDESSVLLASMELSEGRHSLPALKAALAAHPDVIAAAPGVAGGELTLASIVREEMSAVNFVREGKGAFHPLGSPAALGEKLSIEQRRAASALLESRDAVTVLIGDAGTGKSFSLESVQAAHLAAGGAEFVCLAPTVLAAAELAGPEKGFKTASTVARFLVDEGMRAEAAGRVVLIDEAGMLSTRDMGAVVDACRKNGARLLLVGDTKQHEAVARGNALRNLTDGPATVRTARLSEVRRQRSDTGRRLAGLMADGRHVEAFDLAQKSGMLRERGSESALIAEAADAYVERVQAGRETLVVCPVWSEIHAFNEAARARLLERGLLGQESVRRETVKSAAWTEAERAALHRYEPGMLLTFHRPAAGVGKGETLVVEKVEPYRARLVKPGGGREFAERTRLICRRGNGKAVRIEPRHAAAYDAGKAVAAELRAGDWIALRGKCEALKLANGSRVQVGEVKPDGTVLLKDGRALPSEFRQWTHGHAVTSHKSQGTSVDGSIVVMGAVSCSLAASRQFYVSNTRFKDDHAVFVQDAAKVRRRLAAGPRERELAREFLRRAGAGVRRGLKPTRGGERERDNPLLRMLAAVRAGIYRLTRHDQSKQKIRHR